MKNQLTPEELTKKTEKELLELQVQITYETYLKTERIYSSVSFIARALALSIIIAFIILFALNQ